MFRGRPDPLRLALTNETVVCPDWRPSPDLSVAKNRKQTLRFLLLESDARRQPPARLSSTAELDQVSYTRRTTLALESITFVVAVNDHKILGDNFLASPCFIGDHNHEILVQEHWESAAKAYNEAIDRATNDLIVFCHQDIILPRPWVGQVLEAVDYLHTNSPRWGVLGCYGVTASDQARGYVYSSGIGLMGEPLPRPAPVQTLDEIVLVLRKSADLRFDETLPNFRFLRR